MKNADDFSKLVADKEFQNILLGWSASKKTDKDKFCKQFDLTEKEMNELHQIWLTLDFKSFEIAAKDVEHAFDEMVWKLADRNRSKKPVKTITALFNQFAKVAAILIVPILIYTTYLQFSGRTSTFDEISKQVTVTCQNGTISNLTLPDGSLVWLNSGSTISYPNTFHGDVREVQLSGEAYFEVVKNRKVPMVVSAGNVNVKVYGTKFNVNAFNYKTQKSVTVTLEEGSVGLSTPLGRIDGKREFFIKPGQTVSFNAESKKLKVNDDDTFYYTSWKDGVLVFRNTTFADALEQLSRKFNVEIELKEKKLASVRIDATFKNEGIDEILRLLAISTPFTFQHNESKRLSDGSYEKSKIYIESN